MKPIFKILYIAAITSLLCACNKDSDFEGLDNNLISLTLTTVNSEKYDAKVDKDNSVWIDVPEEVDLNNAKVEYTISENASILPNPHTITDWNNEHVFNITSYNGSRRTYIVRIRRAELGVNENVVLRTDEDVRAFAEKNISEIKGNLIIGNETGSDSISNIDPITYLTKVHYKIVVNPTYKGKDLAGLRNLEEVGSIIINNDNLEELVLKSLEEIREDFILNSKSLQKLLLPRLKQMEKNTEINTNQLTETNFESLVLLNSFTLKSQSIAVLSFKNLEHITGSLTLKSLPNLIRLNMKKVKKIEKDFTLSLSPAVQILNMNNLEEVNGNFEISGTALSMLVLPNLKYIKGWCWIENNSMMKNISAKKLAKIDNTLRLTNLPVISLADLGLREVEKLEVRRLTSLTDLDKTIEKLQKVKEGVSFDFLLHEGVLDLSHIDMGYEDQTGSCDIYLRSCSNISLLKLPEHVTKVEISGDRDFVQEKVTNISGKGHIRDITYSLVVEPSQELIISGFDKIDRVFSIPNCEKISIPDVIEIRELKLSGPYDGGNDLKTINVPKLKTLGLLSITPRRNNTLTHLNAFAKVGGIHSIYIRNNKMLVDYSGLKKSIEEELIEVDAWGNPKFHVRDNGYNPTYEDLRAGRYVKP